MMRAAVFVFFLVFLTLAGTAHAQRVISLPEKGGLYAAYVVPTDAFDRVDVQLIVLSGSYDDPKPSGTAHLTEHLAAFSADSAVLRRPRERDIFATTYNVATVYINSGMPDETEKLLRLSRAVLDTPELPKGFAKSEIEIVQRETLLRERQSPFRWLRRIALQNLYGTPRGRANNTIDDLPKLSLEAAYQFHKEHYAPSNVTLIVSGKIEPETAAELIERIFGDTEPSVVPPKPWLDHKPDPQLQFVERLESDRLLHDTIQIAKFVDFQDHPSSFDMQGAFFITSTIIGDRLAKALYHEDERFLNIDADWFFAKNADLELTVDMQLMPGFTLAEAHESFNNAMATLLDEPITRKEIRQARQQDIVYAQNAMRRPVAFMSFLKNLAADGFPPITPSKFSEILSMTTDQEVIDFAEKVMQPSAISVVLAEKVN